MFKARWMGSALGLAVVLIAGCAKEIKKPTDLSDTKASLNWIAETLAAPPETLGGAYDHAVELAAAHPDDAAVAAFMSANQATLDAIPQRVCRRAIETGDFNAFEWALTRGVDVTATNEELRKIWKKNPDWKNRALETFPSTLGVFMNEAVKDVNPHFFDQNAAVFKEGGMKLPLPLTAAEYEKNYIHFLGVEASKAARQNDAERIAFLLDHAPGLQQLPAAPASDRKNIKALADHLLYEMKDETLIARLAGLGYVFEGFDLEKVDFNSALIQGLIANPKQAIAVLGLDQPGDPLSRAEARFLLRLPVNQLENLHDQHIDEAIEMCVAAGGGDSAVEFIHLKAAKNPLERADYLKLMALAIQYNDLKIMAFVKKHGDGLRVEDLDLAVLAGNQRAFEKYAAPLLKTVHPTMEPTVPEGGITYGKIREIFANENQMAGLYLVNKLKLTDAEWLQATRDETLLMAACKAGNSLVAKYLVEKQDADVNAVTRHTVAQTSVFGSASSEEGKLSALFFAARGGDAELIEYLLARGARVDATSYFGATPLMFAVSGGHLDAVKALLEAGADPNAEMKIEFKDVVYENGLVFAKARSAAKRAEAVGVEEIIAALKAAGARF